MSVRNWIARGWRESSLRNGFAEYDGPIFEYLQLYTQKSGDEIASQLFSMVDRGGRELAIRPEITPTLARMVNQQINSLARPIKWFSLPRLCRAERPQRGRLREFFQWNVDVIGSDSVLADAECIYTAIDYLRSVGLSGADVVVKISSRSMLAALLMDLGFAREQLDTVYALLDKRPKVSEEAFAEMAAESVPDEALRGKLMELQAVVSLDEVEAMISTEGERQALSELKELFECLAKMGVGDYCEFDIKIVRGLAYYTGPVYEIFDRKVPLRALCGGGSVVSRLSRMRRICSPTSSPALSGCLSCCVSTIWPSRAIQSKPASLIRRQPFSPRIVTPRNHRPPRSLTATHAQRLPVKRRLTVR